MAISDPLDWREGLNLGPALPNRMNRTMTCGIHAYLVLNLADFEILLTEKLPFVSMENLHAKDGDHPAYDRNDYYSNNHC